MYQRSGSGAQTEHVTCHGSMKPRAVLVMATPCDHHRGDACLEKEEGEERKDEEKKKRRKSTFLSFRLFASPFLLPECVCDCQHFQHEKWHGKAFSQWGSPHYTRCLGSGGREVNTYIELHRHRHTPRRGCRRKPTLPILQKPHSSCC